MKIGFTGTRQGMSTAQKSELTQLLKRWAARASETPHEFHHGGCVGADLEAGEIARKLHYAIVIHPGGQTYVPKNIKATVLPERPNLKRNQDIVNAADILIGAPLTDTEEQRSGTWATLRYAARVGKPMRLLKR